MKTFKELGLKAEILSAIDDLGFETPTPVQEKGITHLISSDRDLIATAQTGTGKTAAFSMPLLHHTDTNSKKVQTIILCPTRELCLQISEDIKTYSKYLKGLKSVAVYGGASMETQTRALNKGCQIVIGTPGRTLDLIKRRKLDLSHVRWVVLDEADEMLSMGFKEDLNAILSTAPEKRQTLLFSATLPKAIMSLTKKYMKDPYEIRVNSGNSSALNIDHGYYMVNGVDRYGILRRIVDSSPEMYAIVFCRTRRETKKIADNLSKDGYSADAIHGELSQSQRDNVMNKFRKGKLQLLIATDVAARGLDVDDLTHVINYNLPDEKDIYVHRSGRTGRASNKGIALSIIQGNERRKLRDIEKRIGKKIDQKQVPSAKDVFQRKVLQAVEKIEKTKVNESKIESVLSDVYQKLEDYSKEDLIKRFISNELENVDTSDNNNGYKESRNNGQKGNKKHRKSNSDFVDKDVDLDRFFINIGAKHKLTPGNLLELINSKMPVNNVEIGEIDIKKSFSFFDIDKNYSSEVLDSFKNAKYKGNRVNVEPSNKV